MTELVLEGRDQDRCQITQDQHTALALDLTRDPVLHHEVVHTLDQSTDLFLDLFLLLFLDLVLFQGLVLALFLSHSRVHRLSHDQEPHFPIALAQSRLTQRVLNVATNNGA